MTDETPKLFAPNTAARLLDISRSNIYALMQKGAIRFVLIGSSRRIPKSEIQRLAAEGSSANRITEAA